MSRRFYLLAAFVLLLFSDVDGQDDKAPGLEVPGYGAADLPAGNGASELWALADLVRIFPVDPPLTPQQVEALPSNKKPLLGQLDSHRANRANSLLDARFATSKGDLASRDKKNLEIRLLEAYRRFGLSERSLAKPLSGLSKTSFQIKQFESNKKYVLSKNQNLSEQDQKLLQDARDRLDQEQEESLGLLKGRIKYHYNKEAKSLDGQIAKRQRSLEHLQAQRTEASSPQIVALNDEIKELQENRDRLQIDYELLNMTKRGGYIDLSLTTLLEIRKLSIVQEYLENFGVPTWFPARMREKYGAWLNQQPRVKGRAPLQILVEASNTVPGAVMGGLTFFGGQFALDFSTAVLKGDQIGQMAAFERLNSFEGHLSMLVFGLAGEIPSAVLRSTLLLGQSSPSKHKLASGVMRATQELRKWKVPLIIGPVAAHFVDKGTRSQSWFDLKKGLNEIYQDSVKATGVLAEKRVALLKLQNQLAYQAKNLPVVGALKGPTSQRTELRPATTKQFDNHLKQLLDEFVAIDRQIVSYELRFQGDERAARLLGGPRHILCLNGIGEEARKVALDREDQDRRTRAMKLTEHLVESHVRRLAMPNDFTRESSPTSSMRRPSKDLRYGEDLDFLLNAIGDSLSKEERSRADKQVQLLIDGLMKVGSKPAWQIDQQSPVEAAEQVSVRAVEPSSGKESEKATVVAPAKVSKNYQDYIQLRVAILLKKENARYDAQALLAKQQIEQRQNLAEKKFVESAVGSLKNRMFGGDLKRLQDLERRFDRRWIELALRDLTFFDMRFRKGMILDLLPATNLAKQSSCEASATGSDTTSLIALKASLNEMVLGSAEKALDQRLPGYDLSQLEVKRLSILLELAKATTQHQLTKYQLTASASVLRKSTASVEELNELREAIAWIESGKKILDDTSIQESLSAKLEPLKKELREKEESRRILVKPTLAAFTPTAWKERSDADEKGEVVKTELSKIDEMMNEQRQRLWTSLVGVWDAIRTKEHNEWELLVRGGAQLLVASLVVHNVESGLAKLWSTGVSAGLKVSKEVLAQISARSQSISYDDAMAQIEGRIPQLRQATARSVEMYLKPSGSAAARHARLVAVLRAAHTGLAGDFGLIKGIVASGKFAKVFFRGMAGAFAFIAIDRAVVAEPFQFATRALPLAIQTEGAMGSSKKVINEFVLGAAKTGTDSGLFQGWEWYEKELGKYFGVWDDYREFYIKRHFTETIQNHSAELSRYRAAMRKRAMYMTWLFQCDQRCDKSNSHSDCGLNRYYSDLAGNIPRLNVLQLRERAYREGKSYDELIDPSLIRRVFNYCSAGDELFEQNKYPDPPQEEGWHEDLRFPNALMKEFATHLGDYIVLVRVEIDKHVEREKEKYLDALAKAEKDLVLEFRNKSSEDLLEARATLRREVLERWTATALRPLGEDPVAPAFIKLLLKPRDAEGAVVEKTIEELSIEELDKLVKFVVRRIAKDSGGIDVYTRNSHAGQQAVENLISNSLGVMVADVADATFFSRDFGGLPDVVPDEVWKLIFNEDRIRILGNPLSSIYNVLMRFTSTQAIPELRIPLNLSQSYRVQINQAITLYDDVARGLIRMMPEKSMPFVQEIEQVRLFLKSIRLSEEPVHPRDLALGNQELWLHEQLKVLQKPLSEVSSWLTRKSQVQAAVDGPEVFFGEKISKPTKVTLPEQPIALLNPISPRFGPQTSDVHKLTRALLVHNDLLARVVSLLSSLNSLSSFQEGTLNAISVVWRSEFGAKAACDEIKKSVIDANEGATVSTDPERANILLVSYGNGKGFKLNKRIDLNKLGCVIDPEQKQTPDAGPGSRGVDCNPALLFGAQSRSDLSKLSRGGQLLGR